MTQDGHRLGWKDWLVLVALSALVLLPGIASIPPVDRDESRYAVATSQMLATGDFVDIRFQEEQRYLQYHDMFHSFLAVGLALLALDLVLNYTIFRKLP